MGDMHVCTAPFIAASCSFLSDMHLCTAPFTVASCIFIGHACVYSSFHCCFLQFFIGRALVYSSLHYCFMQLSWTCTYVQLLSLLLLAILLDMHVCTAPFVAASCSFFIGHALVYSSFHCCL